MRREKLVISLVLVVMIVLLGTVSSYAVEITASSSGTGNQTTITPANTAGNTIRPVNAASNANNSVVNSTVNNTYAANNSIINTPKASSTSNSNGLPYAGSGSIAGAFIVVVVLLGSSIFAYKKVSDYNV